MTLDISKFTPEQRAVVVNPAARLVVPAVAGAGKTATIVAKAVATVATGTPADQVLVLAFTRAAVGEFEARIHPHAPGVVVRTIHAACLDWLDRHGAALFDRDLVPIPPPFGVATEAEWAIEVQEVAKDKVVERLQKQEAIRRLHRRGLLRFDELLTLGKVAFESYRAPWRFVFVDEGQDLSEPQWDVIDAIAPDTLVVVGDEAQAIYEFMGARPDVFHKRAKAWPTEPLSVNFRSRPEIVAVANMIVEEMGKTSVPALVAAREDPPVAGGDNLSVVSYFHLKTEREELGAAVEAAKSFADAGTVAVLARYRAQVNVLRMLCEKAGVPYWMPGAVENIWRAKEGQVVLSILRGVWGRSDVDLERAVRATFPNPDFVIENAKRVALADELSLLGGLRSVTTGTEARWWEPIWHELGGLQDKLDRGKVPTDTWHRSWNDATDALEYMGLGGPWIATVSVWAQEQRAAQRPTSVLAWLRDLPMHLEADDLPGPPVCISTIHGVKGCEFDAVILTGMNEGRLPAKDGKIAEDRRLFYVAATRARERLLLTSHGLGESFLGMPEFHQISRFLNEVELAPKIAILH